MTETVIRIQTGRRLGHAAREVWRYRELLFFLTWRDVKVRYKQSAFGIAWAVLQPFLLMVVFSVFLGRFARVEAPEGIPYPIYAYTALVPWTLFANSLSSASSSLVDNANLVTKVYFPRIILPLSAVGSHLLDFLIAMTLLVGMMAFYGISPTVLVFALPLLVVAVLLSAVATGLWLSALNVRYRDVRYALPFLIQLWLFATPVAYPLEVVPDRYRLIVAINPIAGVVEGLRWVMLDHRGAGSTLFVSLFVAIVTLIGGLAYFRLTERTFADWI